jgi:hypothetical protein
MRHNISVKYCAALRTAAALAGIVLATVASPALAQTRGNLSIATAPGHSAATVTNGFDELILGHQAVADGNLVDAELRYREAWQDPAARTDAAEALHRLYASPGIRPRVDESAVRRSMRNLGDNFRRYETDHFILLSDSDEAWTRERGELLEQARAQYYRVARKMDLPVFPHSSKLICVLFDNHTDYQAFARKHDGLEARWVAGYYATASNRVVFYNDATSPAYSAVRTRISSYEEQLRQRRDEADQASKRRQDNRARQLLSSAEELEQRIQMERSRMGQRAAAYSTAKTVHEAVHLLAFNTGMQMGDRDYPFWLSEGLATSFETDDANFSFGPDRSHAVNRRERFERLRREGRLRPLRDLVSRTEAPTHDAEAAEAMYCQSYALFVHLYRADPQSMGRYMSALLAEPAGRIKPERHLELFESHFGPTHGVQARLNADRSFR